MLSVIHLHTVYANAYFSLINTDDNAVKTFYKLILNLMSTLVSTP